MKAEAATRNYSNAPSVHLVTYLYPLPAIVATGLFMGVREQLLRIKFYLYLVPIADASKSTDFYTYTVVLTDTASLPSFDLLVSF